MRKVLFKRSCESSPDLDAVFDMETIDSQMVDVEKTSAHSAPVVDVEKTSEPKAPAVDVENASEPDAPGPDRPVGATLDLPSTQSRFGAQSVRNGDKFQIRTSADVNMKHILPTTDSSLVSELIRFIAVIFQGVSRKFAQLYAAQFTFIKLHAGQFRALFTACVRAAPITDIETMLYTSPQCIILPVPI
jgi:hypothetical protein